MNTINQIASSSLAPTDQLSDATQGTISALQSITDLETQISELEVPADSTVPNLASHVQDTKDTATYWFDTLSPAIKTSLNSIEQFGSTFNSLYKKLSDNAAIIQEGGIKSLLAKAEFKVELLKLLVDSNSIYTQSTELQPLLADFEDQTTTNSRNLTSDLTSEQTQLQADQEQMQLYQEQLSSLQKQLDKAEKEKKTLENPLVIIATLGMSEVYELIENLNGQISSLQNSMDKVYTSEQKDSSEIAFLTQLAGSLSILVGVNSQLSATILTFTSSWQALSDNLSELEGMEDISPDDSWAEVKLEAINNEWQDISAEVQSMDDSND